MKGRKVLAFFAAASLLWRSCTAVMIEVPGAAVLETAVSAGTAEEKNPADEEMGPGLVRMGSGAAETIGEETRNSEELFGESEESGAEPEFGSVRNPEETPGEEAASGGLEEELESESAGKPGEELKREATVGSAGKPGEELEREVASGKAEETLEGGNAGRMEGGPGSGNTGKTEEELENGNTGKSGEEPGGESAVEKSGEESEVESVGKPEEESGDREASGKPEEELESGNTGMPGGEAAAGKPEQELEDGNAGRSEPELEGKNTGKPEQELEGGNTGKAEEKLEDGKAERTEGEPKGENTGRLDKMPESGNAGKPGEEPGADNSWIPENTENAESAAQEEDGGEYGKSEEASGNPQGSELDFEEISAGNDLTGEEPASGLTEKNGGEADGLNGEGTPAADKSVLEDCLAKAQELISDESMEKNRFPDWIVWDLEGAISYAQLVLEDAQAEQKDVDEACEMLDGFITELLDHARTAENMREQGEALLEAYTDYYLSPDCFSAGSFEYFKHAYENLDQLLDEENVKIYEYQKAMDDLGEAASLLEISAQVNKTRLEELMDEAQELDDLKEFLSEDDLRGIAEACEEAELMLKDLRATQKEVNALARKLSKLLKNVKIQEGKQRAYYRRIFEENENGLYPQRAYTESSYKKYKKSRKVLAGLLNDDKAHTSEEWGSAWEAYLDGAEQLDLKNEYSPAVIDLREIYDEYAERSRFPDRYAKSTVKALTDFLKAVEEKDPETMTDFVARALLDQAEAIEWVYSVRGLKNIAEDLELQIDSLEREGLYSQNWLDLLRSSLNILSTELSEKKVGTNELGELSQVVEEVQNYLEEMLNYEPAYLDAEVIRGTILKMLQDPVWTEFMEGYDSCPETYYWLTRDSAADSYREAQKSVDQDDYFTKEDYLDIVILLRTSEEGILLTMDMAPLWLEDARDFLQKEERLAGFQGGLSLEDYRLIAELEERLKQGISSGNVVFLEETQKEILDFQVNIQRLKEPELSGTPKPEESVTPKPGESVTPKPEESVTPKPGESVTPKPEESVTPGPGESVTPKPGESVTPKPEESVTPGPGEGATPGPEENGTSGQGQGGRPDGGNSEVPAGEKESRSSEQIGMEWKKTPASTEDTSGLDRYVFLLIFGAGTAAAVSARRRRI